MTALGIVLAAAAVLVSVAVASWLSGPHGGEITGADLYRAAMRRRERR